MVNLKVRVLAWYRIQLPLVLYLYMHSREHTMQLWMNSTTDLCLRHSTHYHKEGNTPQIYKYQGVNNFTLVTHSHEIHEMILQWNLTWPDPTHPTYSPTQPKKTSTSSSPIPAPTPMPNPSSNQPNPTQPNPSVVYQICHSISFWLFCVF